MPFNLLSPGQQNDLLSQSSQAEQAIAAYQVREGIPSTVDTPGWMRPPPPGTRGLNLAPAPPPPNPNLEPPRPEVLRSNQSQAFQEIVRATRRRNYSDFKETLSQASPSQLRLMERYAQESRTPDFIRDRVSREIQARGLAPQSFQESARPNPTPPQTPPRSTSARRPPTSSDNFPALRTPATSGLRAPVAATAPPRPALPSHWNLFQPLGSPPPPPAVRNVPQAIGTPPTSLPAAAAAGRLAYGAAGGVADFGIRLASGQDVGQAAYGAAGGLAGGLAGQGLGQAIGAGLGFALGGPPGAAIGGVIGGFAGSFAGASVGSGIADRYYPGNNAPLPGASLIGQVQAVPLPRPLAGPGSGGAPLWVPGPVTPFQLRPYADPVRIGNLPDPSNPVSGTGPYELYFEFLTGGEAQRQDPFPIPSFGTYYGPISISQSYDQVRSQWRVSITCFGSLFDGPRPNPITVVSEFTGWPEHPPRNFNARNVLVQNSQPTPFRPGNPWPATPENAPRTHPANDPNQQYFPNPIPQDQPSPATRPAGEPDPGNLGGNEPESQPQRSPDGAQQSTPSDRAHPTGARSVNLSSLPTLSSLAVPLFLAAAPGALPALVRSRTRVTGQRPQPGTQPRGTGTPDPPPPPSTPSEPCRGSRCGQRQLERIEAANDRLDNLERLLLGGGEAASTAAILRKLEQIDQKLGPQIPNGGIGNFIKRLWDNLGIAKILNVLTFITTLHNAKMLSQDVFETLFIAFDQALGLARLDDFLKNSEGEKISTSEWVGNQIEEFFKNLLGDDTVEEIKLKWQRLNRIYQAAQNVLFAFQSILFSIQEALEVIGQWVARIGNALKKYGVVFERAYQWMNPNPDFSNKWFTRLERAEELANALATVTGSIKEVQDSVEYFSTSRQELQTQLETGLDDPEQTAPENQPKAEAEAQAKTDSAPPEIEESDLNRPETDDEPT